MKRFRAFRVLVMAFALFAALQAARASVFVSVSLAPPVLPVYEQPPCPEANWIWAPGYWAYGDAGYYWVPGEWVPAPYAGALWTPGYWGWSAGLYVWHPGYWGPHIGYYGGVNYGFGFFGVGFVGGEWRGGVFAYNTAVMHVNSAVIRNVYVNRAVINNTAFVNNTHVAFSGGPGGVHHDALPQERLAERDQHVNAVSAQQQHEFAARGNTSSYFRNNGGHPQVTATARPMTSPGFHSQSGAGTGYQSQGSARPAAGSTPPTPGSRGSYGAQGSPSGQSRPGYAGSGPSQPHAASAAPASNPAQPGASHAPSGNSGGQTHSQPASHAPSGGGHEEGREGHERR